MHKRIYVLVKDNINKDDIEIDLDRLYDILQSYGIDGLDYSEDFESDVEDLKDIYGEDVIKENNIVDLDLIIGKVINKIEKDKEKYEKYESESKNMLLNFLLYDFYDNAGKGLFLIYNDRGNFEIFTLAKLLADYGALIFEKYPFIKWDEDYRLITTLDYHI